LKGARFIDALYNFSSNTSANKGGNFKLVEERKSVQKDVHKNLLLCSIGLEQSLTLYVLQWDKLVDSEIVKI